MVPTDISYSQYDPQVGGLLVGNRERERALTERADHTLDSKALEPRTQSAVGWGADVLGATSCETQDQIFKTMRLSLNQNESVLATDSD